MLGAREQALVGMLVLVLMLGMGATLTLASFRAILERPRALIVGLTAQFLWTPLVAFGLAKGLGLPAPAAVGLVIIGACPGGTTSNMYTYFARGDVALSISMTALTTVGSLLAMPLLLLLYATPFTSTALRIPYVGVMQVLFVTLVPVALGMLVRRLSLKHGRMLERVGSWAGALVIVLLTLSTVLRNRAEVPSVTTGEWVSALMLGVGALGLGHATAGIAGLAPRERRAIAIEVAVQNSALALGVVVTSFPEVVAHAMTRIIVLYAVLTTLSVGFAALFYRNAERRRSMSLEREIDVDAAPLKPHEDPAENRWRFVKPPG